MDSKSNEILETRNYEQFKLYKQNRAISDQHVERIKVMMEKMGFLDGFPVVVDSQMNIIDGQHRFEAAKRISIPVKYVMVNASCKKGIEMIPFINSTQKKWGVGEYLEYWCNIGLNTYKTLRDFQNYFKYPVDTCIMLLSGRADRDEIRTTFRNGDLSIVDLEGATQIAKQMLDFRTYYSFFNHALFMRALVIMMRNQNYNHKKMLSKLENYHKKVTKSTQIREYLLDLEIMYNFNDKKTESVSFTI